MKPTSEQDGSAIAKLPAEDENQQEDQEQLHSVPGDSYAEQIASLEIENTKISNSNNHNMRHSIDTNDQQTSSI